MDKENWIWMPHSGHFIGGSNCRFHLATYLPNGYLVSTVGDYFPRGDANEPTEIGWGRTHETMVFAAVKRDESCGCPFGQASGSELDFEGYSDGNAARLGHMRMCELWAEKPPTPAAADTGGSK